MQNVRKKNTSKEERRGRRAIDKISRGRSKDSGKKFFRGRTRRTIREESLPTTNKKKTSKRGANGRNRG